MKTNLIFGFDISTKGMSIQRRKMNVVAENIANSETTRTEKGEPYKKKFLEVIKSENITGKTIDVEGRLTRLNVTNKNHIAIPQPITQSGSPASSNDLGFKELTDEKPGEMVFMPDHPDANEKGYVEMSNVNVVNEMVDMIAASRGFEANSTAFGASKQMAKDSLEI